MIGWLTAPLRRRCAAKAAARQARLDLFVRVQAIADGYRPAYAPTMERLEVADRPKRRRAKPSRKAALLSAAGIAVVAAAGVLAYFTATGHGTGTAAAATVSDITLAAGTTSAALYPGGSADVAISVSNPNVVKVHIPSLVLDSGGITSSQSGCEAFVHYTTQDNSGSGYDAQPGTNPLDLTGAISMDTNASSTCQGVTFTIYLKVGP